MSHAPVWAWCLPQPTVAPRARFGCLARIAVLEKIDFLTAGMIVRHSPEFSRTAS